MASLDTIFGAIVSFVLSPNADDFAKNRVFEDKIINLTFGAPTYRSKMWGDTPTSIASYLMISHLEAMDDVTQTLTMHGSMFMRWKDSRLTWNPTDFGVRRISADFLPFRYPELPERPTVLHVQHVHRLQQQYDTILCESKAGRREEGLQKGKSGRSYAGPFKLLATNATDMLLLGSRIVRKDTKIPLHLTRSVISFNMLLQRNSPLYAPCLLVPIHLVAILSAMLAWLPASALSVRLTLLALLSQLLLGAILNEEMPVDFDSTPTIAVYALWVLILTTAGLFRTGFELWAEGETHGYDPEEGEETQRKREIRADASWLRFIIRLVGWCLPVIFTLIVSVFTAIAIFDNPQPDLAKWMNEYLD
ncbi:unnamed protein product, partial [Mesorhabditis spiculigera]